MVIAKSCSVHLDLFVELHIHKIISSFKLTWSKHDIYFVTCTLKKCTTYVIGPSLAYSLRITAFAEFSHCSSSFCWGKNAFLYQSNNTLACNTDAQNDITQSTGVVTDDMKELGKMRENEAEIRYNLLFSLYWQRRTISDTDVMFLGFWRHDRSVLKY